MKCTKLYALFEWEKMWQLVIYLIIKVHALRISSAS